MESLLQGRLRNTHLPRSKAMIPLFEAVINSIHAIEEAAEAEGSPVGYFKIDIVILRESSLLEGLQKRSEEIIEGFTIADNGAGFNDDNWNSFNTLDTLHKEDKGSRGIGRLMWLKAFQDVRIDSVFKAADGSLMRRRFSFDPQRAVVPSGEPTPENGDRYTTITLKGFNRTYVDHCPKTSRAIATAILEHCLWYFVRAEGVPAIQVIDGTETISLDDLFDEHMHADALAETVTIGEHEFEITHVKFRASLQKPNTLNYCAAGRQVKGEALKIPGLTAIMSDENGTFTYAAYLTSAYLTDRVFEQRIGFYIDDDGEGLFDGSELTFRDIRDGILPRIRSFLEASLTRNLEASAERVETFITTKAPRYRSVLRHIEADDLIVDPNAPDKDIDLLLHKQLYKIEERILREGHDILVPLKGETESAYQQRVEEYLQTVSDLKESDLASYVTHRHLVIDLLDAAIYPDKSGRFVNEDTIHELIVPMRKTSDDYEFRRENLWLIDERLSFHDYMASDKTLSSMPITANGSGKEPDVVSLRLYGTPFLVGEKGPPPASLTVIELKRPMRGNYVAGKDDKSDPILQALNYLARLREGTATRRGRPIPNADRIPGFIYVIADLTDELIRSCQLYNLTKAPDGLSYFGFHPQPAFNAYIQVISFDGLVKGARERNRAFFDKLGLPIK